jgi:hypothetical protein
MDLREVKWVMDWVSLAQDRDQWRVLLIIFMNLWGSRNIMKFLSSPTTGSFSRKAQLQGVISKYCYPKKRIACQQLTVVSNFWNK